MVMAVKEWFMPMVTLFMCGLSLSFMVDTGAQVNIIDEQSFKKLKMKPKLYKFGSKLYGYGQNDCINTLGKFKKRVKYGNQISGVCGDPRKFWEFTELSDFSGIGNNVENK